MQPQTEPTASRLRFPDGYGTPNDDKALLAWAHADERLAAASTYWLATASPDGEPHAVPMHAVWLDQRLYFGGAPATKWARNLAANPRLAVHLESGDDVVVVRGEVAFITVDDEVARRVAAASKAKYGYASPVPLTSWVLRPHTAMAWTNLARDPTRWRFR